MKNRKILFVNNCKDDVLFQKDILQHEELEVIISSNKETTISLAKKDKPCIILIKIVPQEKVGFEICKQLSNDLETKTIPILALTNISTSTEAEKIFDVGAFDFINIPYNKTELLARIKLTLRFFEMQRLQFEVEKIEKFHSTIKKITHDAKQPLTLISLSISAIKREIENNINDKSAINKRIIYIEESVKKIDGILDFMNKLKNSLRNK